MRKVGGLGSLWCHFLALVLLSSPVNASVGERSSSPASEGEGKTRSGSNMVVYAGIDVSHHQDEIDWSQVRAAGKAFAMIKATEGEDWTDPDFMSYWKQSKAAGLIRGAYHFFHPDDDAKTQAEHFVATVDFEAGDLAPALDVEVAEGVAPAEILDEIRIWLETVEEAVGIRPILYSDRHFVDAVLALGHLSEYPLWYAEYTSTEVPADHPAGWTHWTFWQSSQEGRVDGVEGDVDVDEFEGEAAAWERLLIQPDDAPGSPP